MALRTRKRTSKEEVVASNGLITANHPHSAEAGYEMLKAGGNAIDATFAAAATSWVVEPFEVCIAGCGFMLIHVADRNETVALEFCPRATKAATADMYNVLGSADDSIAIKEVEGDENLHGHRSVTVPTSVAGFCQAHQRYGSLPLEQVLEPAIHYAENGFHLLPFGASTLATEMAVLTRFPETASIFLNNGFPYGAGDKLVQRDLGQTLRLIAKDGPDAFYRGDVAAAIVDEMSQGGGLVTSADLADYEPTFMEPARVSYRGHDILGIPVANGGITELETLSILNSFDLASLGHNSVEYLHTFIEGTRHAFADRYHYLGDPQFVPVPMKGLLSQGYGASVANEIDGENAALEDSDVHPWTAYEANAIHDPWQFDEAPKPELAFQPSGLTPPSSTSHISAVDKDRNMVSCTHTIASQSMVVPRGTGVQMAGGMIWFHPEPNRANSIEGYKRPLVNMGPLMVMRDGKPFLAIGAPGGRRIMNAVTQVTMNVIDHGMGVQDAIAAPRVDCSERYTLYDNEIDEEVVEKLAQRGHRMVDGGTDYSEYAFAKPGGVLIDPDSGLLHGGVEVLGRAEARGI